MYVGDFAPGSTVALHFNTHTAAGTPITLAGTPAVSVYKGSTTESTSGVSLTVDYDSRTGMHYVVVDTSADGTFYAAGNDFSVVITTGTVNGVSVVGTVVGRFSLHARSALRPTTAGRTLDVSAGGEAGLDWANIGSPTTSVALSGTTVSSSQVAASVTGAVGSVTGNVGGNVVGSVASVTAGVTVATNNDKTGYSLGATGLDSIAVTDPGGVATTFPKMVVQLWRRFFKKVTKTSSEIKTYADDGATVRTTQAISDDNTTQTQGAAS